LYNIQTNKEVVINVVNYSIVRQMAIASIQFDKTVSEFAKSGLTPVNSDLVQPPRIKESPVQMECRVTDIITLGNQGGAGHLIVCNVLRMHIDENVVDNGRINPHKIDLVGRMGRSYYTRASGDSIFTLFQPVTKISIGFDGLPASVRDSHVLSGNDLGTLAGLEALPTEEEINSALKDKKVQELMAECGDDKMALQTRLHHYAKAMIKSGQPAKAASILMLRIV